MKGLNTHIKESLLGNFEDIEASMDPVKEIRKFIKANYNHKGHLYISKEPNENGKYEVSCRYAEVTNTSITSLTNGMFEWGAIDNEFNCSCCRSLTSLEGAPKKTGGDFRCAYCKSLISLEGAPKEVGESFSCSYCDSLTSLEGAPEKVGRNFRCAYCPSLISLEGAPKRTRGYFSCRKCISLTSLEGAPKEVGGDFNCYGCKILFTEEDVRKVCKVKQTIYL